MVSKKIFLKPNEMLDLVDLVNVKVEGDVKKKLDRHRKVDSLIKAAEVKEKVRASAKSEVVV